ncbi:MAG: flagellar biosynthetic protein FliQ [Hyphomicrobiaceae bacterium]|uniref:flagellar biosynthetic protein FliQ n=1 Tax=Pseudorhodoplanes sp. TaxID=1934341 RepID=UPI003D150C2F
MTESDALDLLRYAVWTVIAASSPGVIAAMVIGLIIAVFQALTQIQEVTLTFVPKIVGVFAAVMFAAYFIGASVAGLSELTLSRIETGF